MLIGEGYRTFPVLIYTQFISEVGGNLLLHLLLAIMVIIIALAIFPIQKYISNRYSFSMNSLHPIGAKNYKKENGCHLCNSLRNYLVPCLTLKST